MKLFTREYKGHLQLLFISLLALVAQPLISGAQECEKKFTAEAGPDIDVCSSGSAELHGSIGGGATRAVWRGGKGTVLPDRRSLNIEYIPAPEEAGSPVMLMLVADNPDVKCPSVISEVWLKVGTHAELSIPAGQSACYGLPYSLQASVKGKYKSCVWSSSGDGKFDNPNKLEAKYSPGPEDLKNRSVDIKLEVQPEGVCPSVEGDLTLAVQNAPVIIMQEEMICNGKSQLALKVKIKNCGKVQWTSQGSGRFSNPDTAESIYFPSDEDVKKGTISLVLQAEGEGTDACRTEKSMILKWNGD